MQGDKRRHASVIAIGGRLRTVDVLNGSPVSSSSPSPFSRAALSRETQMPEDSWVDFVVRRRDRCTGLVGTLPEVIRSVFVTIYEAFAIVSSMAGLVKNGSQPILQRPSFPEARTAPRPPGPIRPCPGAFGLSYHDYFGAS